MGQLEHVNKVANTILFLLQGMVYLASRLIQIVPMPREGASISPI